MIKLINIGFSNMIPVDKIMIVLRPDSSPTKRYVSEAKKSGLLVDATHGRRTRSVIILDSKHVVLSSIQPETIVSRTYSKQNDNDSE